MSDCKGKGIFFEEREFTKFIDVGNHDYLLIDIQTKHHSIIFILKHFFGGSDAEHYSSTDRALHYFYHYHYHHQYSSQLVIPGTKLTHESGQPGIDLSQN